MKRKIILLIAILIYLMLRASPIRWTFKIENEGSGQIEFIAIAVIEENWHLYDSDVPAGGPYTITLSIDELKGAILSGKFKFLPENHRRGFDDIFRMQVGTFDKKAIFCQRFVVTDKTFFLPKGDIRAQACNDGECMPPLPIDFSFSAKNLPAGVTVGEAKKDAKDMEQHILAIPMSGCSGRRTCILGRGSSG
jgi:thiol:disulfide interchange protein DsbD